MKLKQLEIKGFKSFADKTVIHFNNDITGIVGPNGCGKSNIVDAIRWVIGEQKSSALRSDKMEELIFNGSKSRKASSLAEVSLTFENDKNLLPTEYHTVTISRHYYRDGESEYKLNNVTCRLKDITSLFLDTGISSDSYAIIELKMVEEILNDKENSRRKLFEQAAGISKYKSRKKETMNKLEATQADLNRVDDLLFEIENNLKSLESQARKTERYYKLKEEYKNLSVDLALFTISGFRQSFEDLKMAQQAEEEKKIVAETEIFKHEAQVQQEKADNLEKEKNMMGAQRSLNELVTSIKQKENDKNIFNENLRFQNDQKNSLNTQNQHTEQSIRQTEQELQVLQSSRQSEQVLHNQMQQEFEQMKVTVEEVRMSHTDLKRTLDNTLNQQRQLERDIVESEKNITVSQVQKENYQKELEQGEAENATRREEIQRLQEDMVGLTQRESEQKELLQHLTEEGDQLEQNINDAMDSIEKSKEELAEVNRKLDARQNEFNLTKSFIDSMEGFPDSIKFLKSNPEWAVEAPLLSDIISVPTEYRVAVETYLEPWLNYYVVKNMEEAMRAVNLLSSAVKGRANFFVLEDFENFEPRTFTQPDGCVSAFRITDTEEKYKKLAAYLLNKVYVSYGEELPKTLEKDSVVIAGSGKYIRNTYTMSGGEVGSISGKRLGRVKNLESLSAEIESLRSRSEQKKNILFRQQEDLVKMRSHSHDEHLDVAREGLNNLRNQLSTARTKIENLENLIQRFEQRREAIHQSVHKLDHDNQYIHQRLAELQDHRNQINNLVLEQQAAFAAVDVHLNEQSALLNQKNIGYLQQQNKVNAIEQELRFKQQQLQNLQAQFNQNVLSIQTASEQITGLEQKLAVAETELIHLYQQKQGYEQVAGEAEQIYYASRTQINEAEETLRLLHKNKELIDTRLNEIKDQTNQLKLQLSGLKERLDIEFHVNIDELLDQAPKEELNREELEAEVAKLKKRLENYGEINPMAIEAFNEMKQRYDFMTAQKNDLVNAKASLLQTIEEIESTAKMQFTEAFASIRENFKRIFKSLFNEEDDADLILLDPNNLLETKIDIIAKPKGKRPLSISQLSGGEKTLTAISLLFALYLLKPAPFCILDEVDAPLDDANVGKFTEIIRSFSNNSQFIMVTHNKQTMATVDAIYGVTMQEEGVSKVVPVDFRSLN